MLGGSNQNLDFPEMATSLVKLRSLDQHLHHYKLDATMLKSIQDPFKLVSGGLTGLLKQIFNQCAFLFNFETKLLYLKLYSLIGIDVNRGLAFLRSYQKKTQSVNPHLFARRHAREE